VLRRSSCDLAHEFTAREEETSKEVNLLVGNLLAMPVRKIPKNYNVITGIAATHKAEGEAAYEGDLERDFIKLMTFAEDVLKFEVQPVKIIYTDPEGKSRSYTPDVLVTFKDGRKPLLVEIKSRRIIKKDWKKLKPKFRAGIRYEKESGYKFKIITEVEIRTQYRDNVVFLLRYRRLPESEADTSLLLQTLSELGEATPETLLDAITDDKWRKAYLITSLWQLVSTHRIGANLEERLTMRCRIWPVG
jgi:hypothetical protein